MLALLGSAGPAAAAPSITTWTYQLTGYGRSHGLDAVAAAPQPLAVVDLARDGGTGYWTSSEIGRVRGSGKVLLAYFTIGTIETYRPEYRPMRTQARADILNHWADWPDEYFVKYWDEWWWTNVVKPRVDQALAAGFDGIYLDTLNAYEGLALRRVPGETRATLARRMADLVVRISAHAKAQRPGFLVFPQNNPELRTQPGYTASIDGIGMEELFFKATDRRCRQSYCAENLADARALRDAGKLVLAVDYARKRRNIRSACASYAREGFAGNPTGVDLNRVKAPCA